MAWHRPGVKPLSEPMVIRFTTHICVARPQWVSHVDYNCFCNIVQMFYNAVPWSLGTWPLQLLWMPMVHCRKHSLACSLFLPVLTHRQDGLVSLKITYLYKRIPGTKLHKCQQVNSVTSTIYLRLGHGWLWNKLDWLLHVNPLRRFQLQSWIYTIHIAFVMTRYYNCYQRCRLWLNTCLPNGLLVSQKW